MTFEDPFISAKEDVLKALSKTVSLYQRWTDLQAEPVTVNLLKEEIEWTTTELRNALRSIEWDLEDLEDTISIIEKNSSKFKIDSKELANRRTFITVTREEVKCMREKLNYSRGLDKDKTARQPISENIVTTKMVNNSHSSTKYTRLENQVGSPDRSQFVKGAVAQQEAMLREQDDQLEVISDSLGTLKSMSHHIATELDEQAVMLDELQNDLECTDSRIDSTMKKVVKVLHLSNDRSQWIAIAVLIGLLFLIVLLFILL